MLLRTFIDLQGPCRSECIGYDFPSYLPRNKLFQKKFEKVGRNPAILLNSGNVPEGQQIKY